MPDFDFTKAGVVTNLETVPEKFRSLYVEGTTDAGEKAFRIDERVAPLVEDFVNTNKNLAQARADKKAASDEAASRRLTKKAVLEFVQGLGVENVNEDEPLDTLSEHITSLTDQVKGGKELKVNLEKVKQAAEQRIAEAVSAEQAKTAKMQSSLERYLVGQAATAAIADAKGSRELLLPIVKGVTKVVQDGDDFVVRVIDAQGDIRYDGTGTPLTLKGLVDEMKRDDKYARAFESEAPAGSGTRPGAGTARVPRTEQNLTPAQKIAQGLGKGQYKRGAAA